MQHNGASYFLTATLLQRDANELLLRRFGMLWAAVKQTRAARPFRVDGWVVLPDHMHCLWTLPPGDDDFRARWDQIMTLFIRRLPPAERHGPAGARTWRRRLWVQSISGGECYRAHLDYLHDNPVKHGYVEYPGDWPYSTAYRGMVGGWSPPAL